MTKMLPGLFLLLPALAIAQPFNDNCGNAIELTDVVAWCSGPGAFTNIGATESPVPRPFCFGETGENPDVWFSFVARATGLNVSVTGAVPDNNRGSLRNPAVMLYSGPCSQAVDIACNTDSRGANSVNVFATDLVIGQRYFIRVSSVNNQRGTFELCINNFAASAQPSGDCFSASVLCDKSTLSVDRLFGNGVLMENLPDDACDLFSCRPNIPETNSVWYKWTCEEPGSLGFTITPLNPGTDIDFFVFEMPNGIDDCSSLRSLRCMLSGENQNEPLANWQRCIGPTGLSLTASDASESCGCQPGDDNFAEAIKMEAGVSYALVILNFSEDGSGFTLEFEGDGTFRGPEIDFLTNRATVCIGESISVEDNSFFAGGLTDWDWRFGPNANQEVINGKGPHQVAFNRAGEQFILLEVTSTDGCIVSLVKTVTVECCPDHFSLDAEVSSLLCTNSAEGAIDLQVSNAYGPYSFMWSDSSQSEDIDQLLVGTYIVQIADQAGCDTTFSVLVDGPPPLELNAVIDMPTCDGGLDGRLEIQPLGGAEPYEISFDNGPFSTQNTLENLPISDIGVRIRDSNECELDSTVLVRELTLELDPQVTTIQPPSCTGFSDGLIEVNIENGLGPYLYDWQDGMGFQGDNSLIDLSAGTYSVQVSDANRCQGMFEFDLEDPLPVSLAAEVLPISCFGFTDGSILVSGVGGSGNYVYRWQDGPLGVERMDLPPGNYQVFVEDENGCPFDSVLTVGEPEELFVQEVNIQNVRCFGDSTGRLTLLGGGGVPPYMYAIGDSSFSNTNVFDSLAAGLYTLRVMDAEGCASEREVVILQPTELLVNTGPEQLIELGENVRLEAIANEDPVVYQWFPPDGLNSDRIARPLASPVNTTEYRIVVTNNLGCMAEASLLVRVSKERPIYAPTVFSPNGDGNNDFFTLYSNPAARRFVTFRVFDRWGELVFEKEDFPLNEEPLGWDGVFRGKPAISGVYAWMAEIEFIDETVKILKGDVTLLR